MFETFQKIIVERGFVCSRKVIITRIRKVYGRDTKHPKRVRDFDKPINFFSALFGFSGSKEILDFLELTWTFRESTARGPFSGGPTAFCYFLGEQTSCASFLFLWLIDQLGSYISGIGTAH